MKRFLLVFMITSILVGLSYVKYCDDQELAAVADAIGTINSHYEFAGYNRYGNTEPLPESNSNELTTCSVNEYWKMLSENDSAGTTPCRIVGVIGGIENPVNHQNILLTDPHLPCPEDTNWWVFSCHSDRRILEVQLPGAPLVELEPGMKVAVIGVNNKANDGYVNILATRLTVID